MDPKVSGVWSDARLQWETLWNFFILGPRKTHFSLGRTRHNRCSPTTRYIFHSPPASLLCQALPGARTSGPPEVRIKNHRAHLMASHAASQHRHCQSDLHVLPGWRVMRGVQTCGCVRETISRAGEKAGCGARLGACCDKYVHYSVRSLDTW